MPDGTVRFLRIGDLDLESGARLPDVTLAYETWGTLNADASNAVLIEHALTGDTHVTRGAARNRAGGSSSPDPAPLSTPTSTSSFPSTCWAAATAPPGPRRRRRTDGPGAPGSRWSPCGTPPKPRPRLADALGIRSWHAVVGGSLGGARALEWAVTYPERVRRCAVISIGASSTAEQIAFAQAQTLAIRQDPHFNGGDYYGGPEPEAGLALARRIAHITYRSAAELDGRFGRKAQAAEAPLDAGSLAGRGRYQVESYLDHQGNKLVRRFDANSYIAITEALMSHDVCRGRGPLAESLAPATADFLIAAVDSDRLYFPDQSRELADALPGEVPLHMIEAPIGHDGFLTEIGQLSEQFRQNFFG